MPGFYREGEYDIAGFSVGIADREKIITGNEIKAGDVIIGLPSSGLHSNGYSLVRKIILDEKKMCMGDFIGDLGETLGEALLRPSRPARPQRYRVHHRKEPIRAARRRSAHVHPQLHQVR